MADPIWTSGNPSDYAAALQNVRSTPVAPQPEPQQQPDDAMYRAHMSHINARAINALNYLRAKGTLKGSGYTEADMKAADDLFGPAWRQP